MCTSASSLLHAMSTSNAEQATHDRINLGRLVKRIENTAEDDWNQAGGTDLWINAQGTLQVSISANCPYASEDFIVVDHRKYDMQGGC